MNSRKHVNKGLMTRMLDYISSMHPAAIMALCTLFSSLGQLFLKLGANRLEFTLTTIFMNPYLAIGLICYMFGAALFTITLRKADLSLAYPLLSLSFVWVSLLSIFFLGETIKLVDWIGLLIIIAGISIMGGGSK